MKLPGTFARNTQTKCIKMLGDTAEDFTNVCFTHFVTPNNRQSLERVESRRGGEEARWCVGE
jgi:hypothetical protein